MSWRPGEFVCRLDAILAQIKPVAVGLVEEICGFFVVNIRNAHLFFVITRTSLFNLNKMRIKMVNVSAYVADYESGL